ncbi:tryptophan 7-halogenase [Amycolatopsis sp. NPDC049688]|uniref:NAD(P)/FAD-dependent oxidoreductase n=1 Tax=Amycolatopsis sp. NPDC049688 TaxID=3154733 RepID=UPI00341D31E8
MSSTQEPHDVIIIGTGLSGTILGAVLAGNGFRVLLLDGTQHPRFAVGESTIGQTLFMLRLIARRYGVPEIGYLGSFRDTIEKVGSSHGRKSNFGFVLHRDGEEPDPGETTMLRLLDVGSDAAHLFRQDSDSYMFHVAIRYGCEARQNFLVEKVDLAEDGVSVVGRDGTVYNARYLVDASGFRSPLARQLELRDEPGRLKHHARSIFTHMVGVRPIDDEVSFSPPYRPPVRFHEGTLHHIFDRGWMWIIPFDNHERATNRLCSVGIQLDPRRYPARDDLPAAEEFWTHVRRFPAVERQLAGARSVREWTRTGRMQYASTRTVGPRWCLMSHAAGFIDPLFSRGLSNTCEIINTLSWRLMEALRDDDFSPDRFAYVERLEQGLLDYNDKLVDMSFISFANFDLWNAVFRIWSAASVIGGKRFRDALARTVETDDDEHCRRLDDRPYPGLWWPTDCYAELFGEAVEVCQAVHEGRLAAQDAADVLIARIKQSDWMVPPLGFDRPEVHFIEPTMAKMAEVADWAARHPRPEIREYLGAARPAGSAL